MGGCRGSRGRQLHHAATEIRFLRRVPHQGRGGKRLCLQGPLRRRREEISSGLTGLDLLYGVGACRHKLQRHAIDAIALVRGRVESLALEDVAQMPAAPGADDFRADRPEWLVIARDDIGGVRRVLERRPPAMRIELLLRGKQFRPTAAADVSALALLLEFLVSRTKRPLSARLAKDAV